MKKTFKRLGAVLLAAFMLLSTTICALAVEGADTSTTGKKITLNVSNVADGDTVHAFKLVSYNDDGNGYTFFKGDNGKNGFEQYIENQSDIGKKTAEEYLANLGTAGVHKLLEGYAAKCNEENSEYTLPSDRITSKPATQNTATLENLEPGYYLLLTSTTSTSGQIYTPLSAFVKMDGEKRVVYAGASDTALPEHDGAYTVSAKSAGGPTIDKKTNATKGADKTPEWKKTAAASVGDTVRFYVKVNIPKYTDGTTLNLTVNDTLTNLKYQPNSVRVYSEEPQLSNTKVTTDDSKIISNVIKNTDIAEKYTVDDSTGTGTQKLKFELDYATIMNDATNARSVYIYYEATVQPEAVKNKTNEGTNVASLTYANASTSHSTHKTDDVTTKVYTYYLQLNKKKDNSSEPLTGAKFSIYTEENGKTPLEFVEVTENGTNYYRPAAEGESNTVTEIEADFLIRGLDANTYYLQEVKTPHGYCAPAGRFKIILTSKFNNDGTHAGRLEFNDSSMTAINDADKNLILAPSVNSETPYQFSAGLKNVSTPNLPTTGGTGTVLLSIGGVVLMAAGAYLLFFRKKKEN